MTYSLTIKSEYRLGDRVRFVSKGRAHTGRIFGITVSAHGEIDYLIDIGKDEYSDLVGGIFPDEIAPLEIQRGSVEPSTVHTKFTFGQRVRFDSRLQAYSGEGTIVGINVDLENPPDYVIHIDNTNVHQPGIPEEEITLLEGNT